MKGMLLSFLSDIQKHPGLLGYDVYALIFTLIFLHFRPHYGSDALLKDTECSEIITQLLKGIVVFLHSLLSHYNSYINKIIIQQ